MRIAVYDSKEPVAFWLSQSTTVKGVITQTEYLYNSILNDIFFSHAKNGPTLAHHGRMNASLFSDRRVSPYTTYTRRGWH